MLSTLPSRLVRAKLEGCHGRAVRCHFKSGSEPGTLEVTCARSQALEIKTRHEASTNRVGSELGAVTDGQQGTSIRRKHLNELKQYEAGTGESFAREANTDPARGHPPKRVVCACSPRFRPAGDNTQLMS